VSRKSSVRKGRDRPLTADDPNGDGVRISPAYRQIYAAVAAIPRGRVATYGQVARVAGLPGRARQVGYALHALPPGSPIPWQRVVNARGAISLPELGGAAARQRDLLADDGVELDARGRIDLRRYGWRA
jgi:methylated-DNA-protein-cysteine methyltransferase-like protein